MQQKWSQNKLMVKPLEMLKEWHLKDAVVVAATVDYDELKLAGY